MRKLLIIRFLKQMLKLANIPRCYSRWSPLKDAALSHPSQAPIGLSKTSATTYAFRRYRFLVAIILRGFVDAVASRLLLSSDESTNDLDCSWVNSKFRVETSGTVALLSSRYFMTSFLRDVRLSKVVDFVVEARLRYKLGWGGFECVTLWMFW